jgi:CheY-like chemotaxis protein
MPVDTLRGKKILWVEDDKFLSDVISRKLAKESGEFLYATTGEQALKIMEEHTPDAIVLDLILVGMSGFELLEKIKQNDKTKNVPVLILSNLSQTSDVERCQKLGIQGYFVKAVVTIEEVLDEVKKILV